LSDVRIGRSDGPSEREARVDLIRSAWHGAYGHIFSAAEIDGVFDGRLRGEGTWVATRAASLGTLAARRDGALIGLAGLGLLRNGDAELAALYVHPDHQGQGIGLLLWRHALVELAARGCTRMEVWTLAGGAARRFYEARGCAEFAQGGFEVAGHRVPAVGYELVIPSSIGKPPASQSTPMR
jgi:GNAT superfamily N-acetyltransferase